MNDLEYFPHNVEWPERLPLTGSDKQINCRCVMTEVKQEWDGEGLPPVGIECEVECTLDSGVWEQCTILFSGKKFIIADIEGDEFLAPSYIKKRFRPIKTEEEKSIENMLSIVQSHYRETASSIPDETMNDENWKSYLAALYENGYRKE